MNKSKLLAIAQLVRATPQEKFDMEIWRNSCGSAGCAIGNAIAAGLLPGLELALPHFLTGMAKNPQPKLKNGTHDPYKGFGAVAIELDLTTHDVELLFAPSSYEEDLEIEGDEGRNSYWTISREQVATRIEEFVRTDGAMI